MFREVLRGKIHGAVVTEANVDYTGSITIDEVLLSAAGIAPYEKVVVGDLENGSRFVTYAIAGERDSGVVCVNGAAAHLVGVGDRLIILAFGFIKDHEVGDVKPKIVFVNEKNRINV